MKNVLIISYSPLHRDPRIQRQIEALKDAYSITTIGFTESNIENVQHICLTERKPRSFSKKIRAGFQMLFKKFDMFMLENSNTSDIVYSQISKPNVIVANDWDGLFLADQLIKHNDWDIKIYFDAHEYSPKEMKSIMWKLLCRPFITYVLKNCMSHVAVMSTVAEGIAREYEKYLSLPAGSVEVITNAPKFEPDLKPIQITGGG